MPRAYYKSRGNKDKAPRVQQKCHGCYMLKMLSQGGSALIARRTCRAQGEHKEHSRSLAVSWMNQQSVIGEITLGWYCVACPAALILLLEFRAMLLLHFHSTPIQRLFPYINFKQSKQAPLVGNHAASYTVEVQ